MSINKRISGAGKVGWQVRWSESGRGSAQRSQTFSTRRDAQLFEAGLRRSAQLGAHAPVEPSGDRLGDWLEVWLARGRTDWARTTYTGRRSHVARWIKEPLADVRLEVLRARVRALRGCRTPIGRRRTPGRSRCWWPNGGHMGRVGRA